ncbi:MAG TPA: DUF4404 family protein [Gemmatimonadales bacterium]|jgi:hypothetical protein|nr:DUF4404 family protein [Gemmatimonadales bacterium]
MSDSKLQTVVREIREQLAGAKDLSPETRRSLEALVQDLEAVADRTPGDTAAAEGLQDRLADAVRRLEASHPVLSTTLGNVVDALAFFGL